MNHDELAHLDAAYVLGALEPDEQALFEEHLRACRSCAESVRDLEGMPGLLAHVDESVFLDGDAAPPLPETLLPALLRETRRRRQHDRRRALAVAAAAVVVAAGGTVAWVQAGDRPGDVTAQPTATATASPTPGPVPPAGEAMRQVGQDLVRASLALEEVPWGTRLDLVCSYDAPAGGYGDGTLPSYTMAVQTRDGSWEQVAGWRAVPGRTITVSGATAATRDDIVRVEVRTTSGRALLQLDT